MAARQNLSLDSSSLLDELRTLEFRRSQLPNIREISTALHAQSKEVRLSLPPMTRLKRLEKGLSPMNWKNAHAEVTDLIQPVEKAKPPSHSTFQSIYTVRVPTSAIRGPRTRMRHQSLESDPEYIPPLREYNYRFDTTVQYREALLRVAGMTKLNRK